MRTQQEIIDRISYISKRDFFGFESTDLMCALDFENAKPFLKDEPKVTKEQWESPEEDGTTSRTDGGVRKQIVDYLVFAFGKALDHRGLSSSRSIDHFKAWLFLLGDDELLAFTENDANYPQYGMPCLVAIAKKYAPSAIPDDPDVARMGAGKPCSACAAGDGGGCGA